MSGVWKPELLAPAGNLETAVAALTAGADALYLGLGRFNARSRAKNFTPDELARLLDYAHGMGRKIYVTFNTLLCESELPDAVSALAELAELAPDAVIVQDFGVLYLLRRYFPSLPVHASTQMGIHNSAGLAEMARLGVKRVILERQITGEELHQMAKDSPVELEVFLHGSLCLSLSGRCLLSNYAEETSGNRGACRQLCRRNYRTSPESASKARLSPRDLETMDLCGEYSKLHIASLKIEGRLRGPDYVVPVVRAYRQAIDALPEVSREARAALSRTISRPADWGSYRGFEKMLNPDRPGLFGKRVGTIESVAPNGVSVHLAERIHLGDRFRIVTDYGASMAGFELSRLSRNGEAVTAGNPGQSVFIPGHFANTERGMTLYKIGENGYDFTRQAAALSPARKTIELAAKLDAEGLHVTVPALPDFEFHSESFAPASRCAANPDQLREVLESGAPEGWRAIAPKIEIEGAWFCPGSVLKSLRRELFTALLPALGKLKSAPKAGDAALVDFARDYRAVIPVNTHLPMPGKLFEIPGFIAEGDLAAWREKVQKAYARGVRDFGAGGVHALALLRDYPDVRIYAIWPWAVCNSMAVRMLKDLGVAGFVPHAELPQPELDLLAGKSELAILPQPEDVPLLVTRCPIPEKVLLDRQERRFTVHFDPVEKLWKLFGETPATGVFHKQQGF